MEELKIGLLISKNTHHLFIL